MTEERLKAKEKEINYRLKKEKIITIEFAILCELFNEVVRLRKILNCKEELCKYLPEDTEFIVLTKDDYERLTLEQLTGVENA